MKDGKECKPCRICGDKAYYNFYGTIACDSCRTFFRRQSLQRNHLICAKRTNNCFINKLTRRVCSRCRMVACLRQGMNPNQVALCESTTASPFIPSLTPVVTTSGALDHLLSHDSVDDRGERSGSYLDDSSRSSSSRPSSALSLHSTSSSASVTAIATARAKTATEESSIIIKGSALINVLTGAGGCSKLSSVVNGETNVHNQLKHHFDESTPRESSSLPCKVKSVPSDGESSLMELLRKQRHNNLFQVPEPYWKLPPTVSISSNSIDLTGLTNIEKRRMIEIMDMSNDTRHLQLQFINIDDRLMNLSGAIQKILFSFIQIVAPRYWSLESMEHLTSSDRRILIEQGLLDLIMIRSIYHFNVETKTWELTCFAKKDTNNNNSSSGSGRVLEEDGVIDVTSNQRRPDRLFSSLPSKLQFDEVRSNQCDPLGFFASYFKFIESVTFPGLCHDSICSTLWGTICLFNPHNKPLHSPEVSQMEMTIYINLLRHYIKQRFPNVDVNSAVNFLYNMTSEIITLSQMCAQLPLTDSSHSIESLKTLIKSA